MIVLTLLLSILQLNVLAQRPTPCNSPPQWEATIFELDDDLPFVGKSFYSYDSVYQRDRTIEEYIYQNDYESFDTIRLYAQLTQYKYNFKTKQCLKQPIARPWINISIPQNATFYGYNYLGSSGIANANVLTQSWSYNSTDSQGTQIQYAVDFTDTGCIPVSIIAIYRNSSQITNEFHRNYFNITPGISNPSQFVPRPECLQLDNE